MPVCGGEPSGRPRCIGRGRGPVRRAPLRCAKRRDSVVGRSTSSSELGQAGRGWQVGSWADGQQGVLSAFGSRRNCLNASCLTTSWPVPHSTDPPDCTAPHRTSARRPDQNPTIQPGRAGAGRSSARDSGTAWSVVCGSGRRGCPIGEDAPRGRRGRRGVFSFAWPGRSRPHSGPQRAGRACGFNSASSSAGRTEKAPDHRPRSGASPLRKPFQEVPCAGLCARGGI